MTKELVHHSGYHYKLVWAGPLLLLRQRQDSRMNEISHEGDVFIPPSFIVYQKFWDEIKLSAEFKIKYEDNIYNHTLCFDDRM